MRKFYSILLALSLCSCGFQVIYQERSDTISYAKELSAIRIQKDRNRLGQELKNNLYDILNPDYIKSEPKYFLITTISKTNSPTFITETGASGRNKVTLVVTYELKSLESGNLISKGSASVNDNYDVTTNRYGTYTAEEYINTNLTMVAAQNIRNSLVNDIIEIKKKCSDESLKDTEFSCPFSSKQEGKD